MSAVALQVVGRRCYITGDTYRHRDALRAAGAHWDGDRRAWWLGGRAKAEELVAQLTATATPASPSGGEASAPKPSEALASDARVIGRGTYRGRACLVLWEGTTRRGPAAKLASMDGARVFWAARGEYEITKVYGTRERYGRTEYMTFGRLQRLREEAAEDRRTGVDTSYAAYREAIDGLEDQDYFDGAAALERGGYAEWKRAQRGGGAR